MKIIIIYVEGPSDKLAMEQLLESLLQQLVRKGIAVQFIPTEGKKNLITKTPAKALNILRNIHEAVVIAYPDLYPPNMGVPHRTFEELKKALIKKFQELMVQRNLNDNRILSRFSVRCFKYDLEALLLAAEEALASRLGLCTIKVNWTKPVENQNHKSPPKRIVERLFANHGQTYKDTIDAPLILGMSDYSELARRCPQQFGQFISFLESFI